MSDDTNYRYDVFISYRWIPPDQSWVQDHLEPALTNAGLEVFLDVGEGSVFAGASGGETLAQRPRSPAADRRHDYGLDSSLSKHS